MAPQCHGTPAVVQPQPCRAQPATVEPLLAALRTRGSSSTVANQYAGAAGERRLANLQRYLDHVMALHPSVVIVGEAPGYRGAAVTGVPLTTRTLLACDLGRWHLFRGLGLDAADALGAPENEITATVVWRAAVQCLSRPPLTWNAFPFHPHYAGDTSTNRPLTAADRAEGAGYLRAFLALVPGTSVIAMGRQAECALRAIGVAPLAGVRHPSHGGAASFAAGLAAAARRLPAS